MKHPGLARILTRQVVRLFGRALLVVVVVLFVAALPLILRSETGDVQLRPTEGLDAVTDYFRGLRDGSSLTYIATHVRWSFLKEAPEYLRISLSYASLGLGFGLVLGPAFSLILAHSHARWYAGFLYYLDSVPDFVVALLMQLFAVLLARTFDGRVVRIAHAAAGHLVLLPILALSLYVFLHVLRSATAHAGRLLQSDFVAFSRALGYSESAVLLRQVLPGLLPVIRSELRTIVSNVIAAIVIAEQLFLIPGIARLLFNFGYRIDTPASRAGYQYPLVVNALLAVACMYVFLHVGSYVLLHLVSRLAYGDGRNAEATY